MNLVESLVPVSCLLTPASARPASRPAAAFPAHMLDAQKAALQNTIRQRLVGIREQRRQSCVAQLWWPVSLATAGWVWAVLLRTGW